MMRSGAMGAWRIAARAGAFVLAMLACCAHAATPAIGGGERISAALGTDGALRTWGDDSAGALGLGRPLTTALPSPVTSASSIVAIDAGLYHVLALKSDGTVLAWGYNQNGELGDGTRTNRSTPVRVNGLDRVIAIAAGDGHSVALKGDGSVWRWGGGDAVTVPLRVEGLDNVVEISAGYGHTLARTRDGSVWAWGLNDFGQLGDGTRTDPGTGRLTPALVAGLANVVAISAGAWHSLALLADGSVRAWGGNGGGALGDGTSGGVKLLPQPVSSLASVTAIFAGQEHSYALRRDGSVVGWGANDYGQLGDNTYGDRPTPIAMEGLAGTLAISVGFRHSFALIAGGTLASWGANDTGQLGDPSVTANSKPAPTPGISGVMAVSVGDAFTVALKVDGTVLAWGDNTFGQLGNGALTLRATPSDVPLAGVAKLAVGGFHILALKGDGSVYAWGDNRGGQVGDGNPYYNRSSPLLVISAGSGVTDVSGGGIFSLALKSDGTVLSWGDNFANQIGDRENNDGSRPARVLNVTDAVAVSAGGAHSVVLKRDGSVLIWGNNSEGQLGDGTVSSIYGGRTAALPVAGLSNVTKISAGDAHTVVLRTDGALFAWGANESGQLGDGTTVMRTRPVRVASGLTNVIAISAGSRYTLALRSDGTVWAWGASWNGRLGVSGSGNSAVPIPVPGLTDIIAISASSHSFALRRDGSVFAFGGNSSGELGDGTLVDRDTPVIVLGEEGEGSIAGNNWFLDLDPGKPTTIPPEKVPVFLVVASATPSSINAQIRYRAQDVGTNANTYVFALAPSSVVKDRPAGKDGPVPCVLSQLNAAGQLQGVSASGLQAAISGTLGSQAQAVSVLNNAAIANASGATFFVGYGATSSAMFTNGTNRSVVTIAGSTQCQPQAPQTGWWWNPAEGGRGYSIEARGNNIFFAAFHYDISGRSTWNVATGPMSLDGSLYQGDLYAVSGGQTLGGPYTGFPRVSSIGQVTLAFTDATHGTMIWPGGTVAIERFNIVPNGLSAAPQANQPESGWWWNPNENGRGFFMEWQNGTADIAGYMYDDAGNPVWYIAVYPTPDAQRFSGNWWSYANGQTMGGPYKPATRVSDNVAPVTIQFSGPDTALMTLPNGRTTTLTRQRF